MTRCGPPTPCNHHRQTKGNSSKSNRSEETELLRGWGRKAQRRHGKLSSAGSMPQLLGGGATAIAKGDPCCDMQVSESLSIL
jgi:hypothetical protein